MKDQGSVVEQLKSAIVGLLVLPLSAFAVDVTLAWDASPDPVASYRVYHTVGQGNADWTLVATVPSTTLTLVQTNLVLGVHRWHATSVNQDGIESDPSNEVTFTVWKPRPPVLKPVQLRISMLENNLPPIRATLEQALAVNVDRWVQVQTWVLPFTADQAYFRILLE